MRGRFKLLLRAFRPGAIPLLRLGMAALAIFLGHWLYREVPAIVQEKIELLNADEPLTYEPATKALFDRLISNGLLHLDLRTLRLSYPPADEALRQKLAHYDGPWVQLERGESAQELLGILHDRYSEYADLLRRQIAAWNRHHSIAAIRDSRADSESPPRNQEFFVEEALPNVWAAELVSQSGEVEHLRSTLTQKGLSYEHFGFFGWERAGRGKAPNGDWIHVGQDSGAGSSAGGESDDTRRVRFLSYLDPSKTVIVDVLGRDYDVGGARYEELLKLCRERSAGGCGDNALGHRLRLRARSADRSVTVEVSALANLPDWFKSFASASFVPTEGDWSAIEQYQVAGLELRCGYRDKRPECALAWQQPSTTDPFRSVPVRLLTADGVPLTAADGTADILDEAKQMGLAALVGLGAPDVYGLGSAIRRRPRLFDFDERGPLEPIATQDFPLSLDARLQTEALQVLTDFVSPSGRHRLQVLPKDWDQARRAALVLIDAGGRGLGRVLAAATLPEPDLSRSLWNNLARDSHRPLASPLAAHAWQRLNVHSTAGSVFKVIPALALLAKAAEDQAKINWKQTPYYKSIKGLRSAEAPALPLPTGVVIEERALRIPRLKKLIHNASHSHAYALLPPKVTGCKPLRGSPETPQYGLCEALATSTNTWFMAVALALDRDVLPGINTDPRLAATSSERLSLTRAAARVLDMGPRDLSGIDRPSDSVRKIVSHRYWIEGAHLGMGELHIRPTDGALVNRNNRPVKPLQTHALNAIGQDVMVSPLAVAGLYASIANRCRVKPWIAEGPHLGEWGVETKGCTGPLAFDDATREGRVRDMIDDYLEPGLHAVVNSKIGTAYAMFRKNPLRERIHAKTGTAQTNEEKKKKRYTAWLAGWIDPPLGSDESGEGRIAFACMVSHSRAYGGPVCGRIVNAMALQLAQRERDGQETAGGRL